MTNMQENEVENLQNTEMNINADSEVPGTNHLNEPLQENEEDKTQAELQELKDKYLRLVAEFDNFKKRNAKERMELIQTAGKDIIQNLLDVLDDADRAEKQINEAADTAITIEGVKLVFNKLRNTLQARGLKAMETKGEAFNADIHEAVTEIPAATDDQKGLVVDELIKGYYLNDKIIRFAKVVVSN
jgi:molecular chaperone GrpE